MKLKSCSDVNLLMLLGRNVLLQSKPQAKTQIGFQSCTNSDSKQSMCGTLSCLLSDKLSNSGTQKQVRTSFFNLLN